MTDQLVGIRIQFDAKTGEVKVAAADIAKLRREVDRNGKEMREADRATQGWFARFKSAHPVGAHFGKYLGWAAAVTTLVKAVRAADPGRASFAKPMRARRPRSRCVRLPKICRTPADPQLATIQYSMCYAQRRSSRIVEC